MNKDDRVRIFATLGEEFNKRCAADPTFKHNVQHFCKTLQVTVSDVGETYYVSIEHGCASPLFEGVAPRADIFLSAPMKKILAILVGQIPPTRIIMEPDIKIRGSPPDLMFINKFLLKETPRIRELIKSIRL